VFRMSLVMAVRGMLCSVRRNSLNVLNYNFMLPEDDRVVETCRNVLSVLMLILDFLNNIYVHVLVFVIKYSNALFSGLFFVCGPLLVSKNNQGSPHSC